ncbi:ChbG/HpnK family deacetylase [Sphingomonas azotifigens]|uniref:ChbG/HpnK family deacetylase n=1 Tax=Sphingomonas azotifigens TaxID=330920 RepID=UPI000A00FFE4|nr:ChbG/HpnK family deacetylase [Sphingomonas azotifigens]
MSRLILCSDDFGYSSPISKAIVTLAQAGKINAISCMAVMPGWAEDARMLADVPAHVQIGLHLTLTGEVPRTRLPRFAPAGRLPEIDPLTRAAGRWRVPLDEIATELSAQFAAFSAAMRRPPDFVDGHQHAHALPGIRDLVLAETAARAPRAWVRDCTDRATALLSRPFVGKAIGSAWHSRGLRRAAAALGLRTNTSFAGHYDFRRDYAALFARFLRRPGAMHLVMCHPGAGERPGDTIAAARIREAKALHRLPIADMAAAEGLVFPA